MDKNSISTKLSMSSDGRKQNTNGKTSWRIMSHCPTPSMVEGRPFFHEYPSHSSTTERFGINLAFDFQGVQRQQNQ
jgi:hypothetical protein